MSINVNEHILKIKHLSCRLGTVTEMLVQHHPFIAVTGLTTGGASWCDAFADTQNEEEIHTGLFSNINSHEISFGL